MALITAPRTIEKEKIKLELDKEIYAKVRKYCAWANIENIDYFFEQAVLLVFDKDTEWKKNQKKQIKIADEVS